MAQWGISRIFKFQHGVGEASIVRAIPLIAGEPFKRSSPTHRIEAVFVVDRQGKYDPSAEMEIEAFVDQPYQTWLDLPIPS